MPIAASKRRIQQILGKSNSSNSEYREYKRRWQQIFSPLLHNSKVFTSFSWQSHLKMFGICQHAPMNKGEKSVENPRKRGEVSENVWISNELISSVRCCISQIICKAVGGDGASKRGPGGVETLPQGLAGSAGRFWKMLLPLLDELQGPGKRNDPIRRTPQTA